MTELFPRLDALLQNTAPDGDPIDQALALLADPALVQPVLAHPDACIARAAADFRAAQRRLLNLAARFAEQDRASLHRTTLDPRGVVATATSAYIQRAGIYLPTELQALRDEHRIDPAWHARESLRLAVFLRCGSALVAHLDRDEIPPDDYARRTRELALRVAAAPIAITPPDEPTTPGD